eukprot:15471094-Alexandrium_andersonii.AAC.1
MKARLGAWKAKLQHKAPARAAFDFVKGVSQGATPGALVRVREDVLTGSAALAAIAARYEQHFRDCQRRAGTEAYAE